MAGAVFVLGLLSLLLGPTRSLAAAIVVPKATGDVFIDDDGVDVRDRHVVLLKPSADLDQHLQYVHASFQQMDTKASRTTTAFMTSKRTPATFIPPLCNICIIMPMLQ